MTATMTDSERVTVASSSTTTSGGRVPTGSRWAALAAVSGVVLATGAAAVLGLGLVHRDVGPSAAKTVSEGGFPQVGITGSSYLPGHSSGWHQHPGLHSVVVLKGTLTIYDENCAPTAYEAGQTYLGGSDPHLARNETSELLDVAITYVYRTDADDHGSTALPPPGCDLR